MAGIDRIDRWTPVRRYVRVVVHGQRQLAAAGALFALAASLCAVEPPDIEGVASHDTPLTEQAPASSYPVRRIAASFGFEERANPYPVPEFWARAQDTERVPRPGFPRFNQAEFDFKVAHTGGASVRLPTRGGGTSLRLGSGVIPVFAGGDYAISAWVRTTKLQHARAFIIARMVDQNSRPVAGAEVRSEPIVTRGEWTQVAVQLIDTPGDAAYMQVEFEVLQPHQYRHAGADDAHAVMYEDLDGAAWFDDLVVQQLPRVEMTTAAPANIVIAPDVPVMRILVRDFVGERLDGNLAITDLDGVVVQETTVALATAGRPQEWKPNLPRFGWYRATLSVLGEQAQGDPYRVGGAEMTFLWSGPRGSQAAWVAEGPRADSERFGIIADQINPALYPALAGVGRATGTGFVSVPLWDDDATRDGIPAALAAFGEVINSLGRANQRITVCIPTVPNELAEEFQLSRDDPLALAEMDAALWMPYLQPALDRYGQRLTNWQVGRAGTVGDFWRADMSAAAAKLVSHLAALVPGPRLAVPWSAEYEMRKDVATSPAVSSVVMTYPSMFGAESMATVIDELGSQTGATSGGERRDLVIVPELLSSKVFGDRAVVTELARRAVEFWAARTKPGLVDRPILFALSHPWETGGGNRPQMMPSPALGAMRTLVDHLSDRRVLGEYRIGEGMKCYILADMQARSGSLVSGALVAWNESRPAEEAVLARYLGDGPIEAVDIFGNRTAVNRSSEAGGPHMVRLSETPVFIEGIDPMLALFCMQVAVDPSFLPAVQTEHDMSLTITNPWAQAISGKLQIVPPTGQDGRRRWSVAPDGIIPFSLGSGQTRRIPWSAAFPYFEETGEKQFHVVVRLTTNHELPPIMLPLTLRVGLQDLSLDPEVQLGPRLDGPDVIIIATVSNRGDKSRMLKLEAVAAGIPTQQTVISDLPAGEVVIRRIVLKDMAAKLAGKRVHLSLSDTDEQERLNMSIRVP